MCLFAETQFLPHANTEHTYITRLPCGRLSYINFTLLASTFSQKQTTKSGQSGRSERSRSENQNVLPMLVVLHAEGARALRTASAGQSASEAVTGLIIVLLIYRKMAGRAAEDASMTPPPGDRIDYELWRRRASARAAALCAFPCVCRHHFESHTSRALVRIERVRVHADCRTSPRELD